MNFINYLLLSVSLCGRNRMEVNRPIISGFGFNHKKVKIANGVFIETLKFCKETTWLKPVLLLGSQRKNVTGEKTYHKKSKVQSPKS